jgi:hypothetical protein
VARVNWSAPTEVWLTDDQKRPRAPAAAYDGRMNADLLRHGNTLTSGTDGRLPPHQLRSADFPSFRLPHVQSSGLVSKFPVTWQELVNRNFSGLLLIPRRPSGRYFADRASNAGPSSSRSQGPLHWRLEDAKAIRTDFCEEGVTSERSRGRKPPHRPGCHPICKKAASCPNGYADDGTGGSSPRQTANRAHREDVSPHRLRRPVKAASLTSCVPRSGKSTHALPQARRRADDGAAPGRLPRATAGNLPSSSTSPQSSTGARFHRS